MLIWHFKTFPPFVKVIQIKSVIKSNLNLNVYGQKQSVSRLFLSLLHFLISPTFYQDRFRSAVKHIGNFNPKNQLPVQLRKSFFHPCKEQTRILIQIYEFRQTASCCLMPISSALTGESQEGIWMTITGWIHNSRTPLLQTEYPAALEGTWKHGLTAALKALRTHAGV